MSRTCDNCGKSASELHRVFVDAVTASGKPSGGAWYLTCASCRRDIQGMEPPREAAK